MDENRKPSRQSKWEKENRERLIVIAPKGTREKILSRAPSINSYINRLIDEDMAKEEPEA